MLLFLWCINGYSQQIPTKFIGFKEPIIMTQPPQKVVQIFQGLNNPHMQPNYEENENYDRNQQASSQCSSSVKIGEDVNSNPVCVRFCNVILAFKGFSVFLDLEALMLSNRSFCS